MTNNPTLFIQNCEIWFQLTTWKVNEIWNLVLADPIKWDYRLWGWCQEQNKTEWGIATEDNVATYTQQFHSYINIKGI